MWAPDNDAITTNNYFVCSICLKVVIDPKECSTCNNLICSSCLQQWDKEACVNPNFREQDKIQSKKICPMQCANPTYTNIHRFSKQELHLKRFKCPNNKKGCLIGINQTSNSNYPKEYCFTYPEALNHLNECLYHTVACDFLCGKEFKIVERDEHLKDCPNFKLECKNCNLMYKRKDEWDHNCVKSLKEELAKKTLDLQQLGFGNLGPRPNCKKRH